MSSILTAVISNAAVVAVLAPLVWLMTRWARKPAVTHALWVLLLVKLITPPLVAVPLPWSITVEEPSLLQLLVEDALAVGAARPSGDHADKSLRAAVAVSAPAVNFIPDEAAVTALPAGLIEQRSPVNEFGWWNARFMVSAVLWVWVIVSAALLVGVLLHVVRFIRQIRGTRLDECVASEVLQLCRQLQLGRGPRVASVDGVVSPMLWGAGPFVWLVFPRQLSGRLTREQRRSLLIHELGHYHRRDPWVRLLELTCGVLFWWHPVVWYARRQIEAAGEECCDALVVGWSGSPRTYAEAIVNTLDFISERPRLAPPLASGVSPVPVLQQRLTQIMRRAVDARLHGRARFAVMAWCLATMLFHPFLPLLPATRLRQPSATLVLGTKPVAQPRSTTDSERIVGTSAPPTETSPSVQAVLDSLPSPPTGWWSQETERSWATTTSPDGRSRLVAEAGRQVRLELLDSSTEIDLSDAAINCAAYLPSGEFFVTGSARGHVQLWDSRRGKAFSEFKRLKSEVKSIAVDSTGRYVVTGSSDGAVLTWEVSSGVIMDAWTSPGEKPVTAVRFAPDGVSIAVAVSDWRDPTASAVHVLTREGLSEVASIEVAGSVAAVQFDAHDSVRFATWDGRLYGWNPSWRMIQWSSTASRTQIAAAAFSQGVSL